MLQQKLEAQATVVDETMYTDFKTLTLLLQK